MANIVSFGVLILLLFITLVEPQEKQTSCSTFGYELITARLDGLESIAMKSQLSSTGEAQSLRNEIQKLTGNIQSLIWRTFDGAKQPSDGLLSTGLPRSCSDVPSRKSGVYRLDVSRGIKTTFEVYCDQDFEGGGWLVFQNRFNGDVEFNRPWPEYKDGFGSLNGEFWLGMDKLYEITNSAKYELAITMEGFDGDNATARYSDFAIGSEAEFYHLNKLGKFSGTANDSLSYHLNAKFSTFDRDNDEHNTNCALTYLGAWWYKACHHSNLNAHYDPNGDANKIVVWRKWKGDTYALKRTRMMIRKK